MCRLQPPSSSTYCTAGVDRCPVATLGSVSKTCRATPSCWQTAEVGVFNNSPLRLPRLFCFRPSPFHIHHCTSTPPSYSTCNSGGSDRSDIVRLGSPPEKTISLLQSDVASSSQTPLLITHWETDLNSLCLTTDYPPPSSAWPLCSVI